MATRVVVLCLREKTGKANQAIYKVRLIVKFLVLGLLGKSRPIRDVAVWEGWGAWVQCR